MNPHRHLPAITRASIPLILGLAVGGLTLALAACNDDPGPVAMDPSPPAPPEPPAPPGSVLARLRGLDLDSLPAPVPTYFSPGERSRAEFLQAELRAADAFFAEQIDVQPPFHLAVLSEEHWAAVTQIPYGAFTSGPPYVAVMAAFPEKSAPTQIATAAKPALPADAAEDLAQLGVSYEEAAVEIIDLIGLHELGHIYTLEFGFEGDETALWLGELLATYAAYSFLQTRDPDAIIVWDALSKAIVNFAQPSTLSLDDFNEIYLGLGVATYGWFQSHFNLRVSTIVDQRPAASWFAELRAAGLTGNTAALPTSELLGLLDETVPGFVQWADSLGLEYE